MALRNLLILLLILCGEVRITESFKTISHRNRELVKIYSKPQIPVVSWTTKRNLKVMDTHHSTLQIWLLTSKPSLVQNSTNCERLHRHLCQIYTHITKESKIKSSTPSNQYIPYLTQLAHVTSHSFFSFWLYSVLNRRQKFLSDYPSSSFTDQLRNLYQRGKQIR